MDSLIKFLDSFKIFLFSWIGFVILLIAIVIFFLYGHFSSEPIEKNITILFADSTLIVSQTELSTHNINLISTLQGREAIDINSIVSQVSVIIQNRVIYMALIGIILTLLLRNNRKTNNSFIYIFLLILIISFYGLDIHQEDLLTRSEDSKEITSNALDYMVNLKPTDTSWYYIDYAQRNSMLFEKNSEFCTRIPRKINAVFQKPNGNLIQIIYYIFPWGLIYLYIFKMIY